jgi:hypothetical protein
MGPWNGGNPGHFSGWGGSELAHNIILPQAAVGGGITMTVILTNMGGSQRMDWCDNPRDYSTSGTLRFFADNGGELPVIVNGKSGSTFSFNLGASEVSFLEVTASSEGLRKGWLLIEVDEPDTGSNWGFMDGQAVSRGERLMVTAYYSITDQEGNLESQVAVSPQTFCQELFGNSVMAAQSRQSAGGRIRTGVAIVNTTNQSASVELRLIGTNGQQIGASVMIKLAAGNQTARFVDELFGLTRDFEGVLDITTTDDGIVSMGLAQTGLVTTSIPTHHYGNWSQYN